MDDARAPRAPDGVRRRYRGVERILAKALRDTLAEALGIALPAAAALLQGQAALLGVLDRLVGGAQRASAAQHATCDHDEFHAVHTGPPVFDRSLQYLATRRADHQPPA